MQGHGVCASRSCARSQGLLLDRSTKIVAAEAQDTHREQGRSQISAFLRGGSDKNPNRRIEDLTTVTLLALRGRLARTYNRNLLCGWLKLAPRLT